MSVVIDAISGGIEAIRLPSLGQITPRSPALFVMEVPTGGDRTAVIQTADQRLARLEHATTGSTIRMRWKNPVTNTGVVKDGHIDVELSVTEDAITMSINFDLAGVEAVRFPSFDGIRPPPGEPLDLWTSNYSSGSRSELLPKFMNDDPYWGTLYPDHASGQQRPELLANPTSPFSIIAGARGGFILEPATPTQNFIGWRVSLVPGFADRIASTPSDEATIAVDVIQIPVSGQSVVPVRLTPFDGPWTAALVGPRSAQGATFVSPADWLHEPHSWFQVQLMSTELERRYDFAQLAQLASECAESGIRAIQVVGWNEGGQDGLVPVHRPAEILGGTTGLIDALEIARGMGVKTILYAKYQWVEHPSPYWSAFEHEVCLDELGQPYAQPGPAYYTTRKRYGMSTPWYLPLCFSSPRLRARFAEEVRMMAEWGADGVLLDESLYHGRALLCFAEHHEHEPGASAYSWDRAFIDELRSSAHEVNPEFVLAAEGAYDAQFEYYDVSYFRSWSPTHEPMGRRLRSTARMVTATTGSDDRGIVHQALRFGYALSFEPLNFTGRLSDMRLTVAYGVQIDRLRTRFADWLWGGEFVALEDAGVTTQSANDAIEFAAWVREGSGPAVVATNDTDDDVGVLVAVAEAYNLVAVLPSLDVVDLVDARFQLPARTAAVIVKREWIDW